MGVMNSSAAGELWGWTTRSLHVLAQNAHFYDRKKKRRQNEMLRPQPKARVKRKKKKMTNIGERGIKDEVRGMRSSTKFRRDFSRETTGARWGGKRWYLFAVGGESRNVKASGLSVESTSSAKNLLL